MLNIPGLKLTSAEFGQSPENYIIYGHHTAGKTNFAATAVEYYHERDKRVLYVVTPGEDPSTTLAQFGLGDIIVHVKDIREWEDVCKKASGKIDVIIVDSLKGLQRMSMDRAVGKDKYPKVTTGKDAVNEWPAVHDAFATALNALRDVAPVSIGLCPADRSTDSFLTPDEKKPNLIGCDLAGKYAASVRGLVSYMGYVESNLDETTKQFERAITFVPARQLLTVARGLVRQMTSPIPITGVHGGWEAMQLAFEEHRKPVNEVLDLD